MISTLSILLASSAVATQSQCSSLDYKVVRSTCVHNIRNVTWVKEPRLEVWDCLGPETIPRPQEGCQCVPVDMVPVFEKHHKVKSWKPARDAANKQVCTDTSSALKNSLPKGTTLASCTVDDIGFEYTECTPDMTQQIVSYYINNCRPTTHAVTLTTLHQGMPLLISVDVPATPTNYFIKLMSDAAVPVLESVGPGFEELSPYIGMEITEVDHVPVLLSDISKIQAVKDTPRSLTFHIRLSPAKTMPCDKQCEEGTYRAAPMFSCGFCPKGTHSVRGDIYNTWNNESWPSNLATRCYANDKQWECNAFTMRGDHIDSGDQPVDQSTTSILNILTEIVTQPAVLRFSYKMDLLPDDAMGIIINGKQLQTWYGRRIDDWMEYKQEISVGACSWKLALNNGETKLGEYCIYRNQFYPFRETNNFPYVTLDAAPQYTMVHLDNDGCDASQYVGKDVSNKIVLLHRDPKKCSFVQKGMVAQSQGAAGVIIMDNYAEGPLIMGDNSTGLNIPMASIQSTTDILAHFKPQMTVQIGRTSDPPGTSVIQFVVQRERSMSTYGGKFMLKDLRLTGTRYAAEECKQCPAGYFSLGGIDQPDGCEPCPVNTHAGAGSDECKPCPSGYASTPGSSSCIKASECKTRDYVPSFGPCLQTEDGARMKLSWVCNAGLPGDPPQETEIPCGPGEKGDCLRAGLIRTNDSCEPCDSWQVPNGDSSSCVSCPASKIPQVVYDLRNGFDTLGNKFDDLFWSTRCTENCDMTSGWEFAHVQETNKSLPQTALVAGKDTSSNLVVDLTHTFTANHVGSIQFIYHVETTTKPSDAFDNTEVFFTLRRLKSKENEQYGSSVLWKSDNLITMEILQTGPRNKIYSFPPGDYKATWTYQKQHTAKPVAFFLSGIVVRGSGLGRGIGCMACPDGYHCEENVAKPCSAGTFRTSTSKPTTCTACPAGLVSPTESSHCKSCPGGTRAEGTPPACVLADASCKWVAPSSAAFDLTALQGSLDDTTGFLINICSKSASCKPHQQACVNASGLSYGSSVALDQSSKGITVTLSEGAECPLDPFRQLGAVVNVVCDPIKKDDYTTHSKVVLTNSSDACRPVYTIVNRAGCPLCSDLPVEDYWTSCVNGTQQRYRKFGNCYGVKKAVVETRQCGGGSSKKWLPAIIVVAVIAVTVLALFVVRLYRQNTALECKYQHVGTDDATGFHDDPVELAEDDYFAAQHQEETSQDTGAVI
eukprot:TRINITY_DN8594_c0_g1_i1.p1 TRINITY_DN8594_c0_g1~~TRINITY_DN8594_c0_g1_i1.p1  ORF type:complete len:1221 (+),score=150.38 TRINITY_DN8594_c0_g1_i1:45-3707(+)